MCDGKLEYYIDGKEHKHANWMRYVSCVSVENNMVAYQSDKNIFYRYYFNIYRYCTVPVWHSGLIA